MTIRRTAPVCVLAALLMLAFAYGLPAQEEDPATSCDVRKAGLDPVKFHVYLTRDTPYSSLPRWPGTEPGRPGPGAAPHGVFVTTYVNAAGMESLQKGGRMDVGSLVVMENFAADGKPSGLSVMLKIKGYNPGAGDWHWFQYDAEGNAVASGRVSACIACHAAGRERDYVMTAPLAK